MSSNTEPTNDMEARIEGLCIDFHYAYEAHAKLNGWETQDRSREEWTDVPEANRATMRMTVATVCGPLLGRISELEQQLEVHESE